jgi:hypothetical protein
MKNLLSGSVRSALELRRFNSAFSDSNAGALSAEGIPLQILPTKVPRLRTWGDAIDSAA